MEGSEAVANGRASSSG